MLVIDLLKCHFTHNLEFLACEKKRDSDTSFASAYIIQFYVFLCFRSNVNYFSILSAVFGSTRRRTRVTTQRTDALSDVTYMNLIVCALWPIYV